MDLIPVQLETITYVTLESGETKPKTKRAYVQPEYKAELEAYLARATATEPIRRYIFGAGIILNLVNVILRSYTEFRSDMIYVVIAALFTLPYFLYPRLKWAMFGTWGFKSTPKIVRTLAILMFIGSAGWMFVSFWQLNFSG